MFMFYMSVFYVACIRYTGYTPPPTLLTSYGTCYKLLLMSVVYVKNNESTRCPDEAGNYLGNFSICLDVCAKVIVRNMKHHETYLSAIQIHQLQAAVSPCLPSCRPSVHVFLACSRARAHCLHR